jgi:signal transduction histidine kinase
VSALTSLVTRMLAEAATWHHDIATAQVPVVGFIFIALLLAGRHFAHPPSLWCAGGWFLNLVYLFWHNYANAAGPADAPPGLAERSLSLASSLVFAFAAGQVSGRKRRAAQLWLLGATVLAVAAVAVRSAVDHRGVPRVAPLLLALPPVCFEMYAIYCLRPVGLDLIRAAGLSQQHSADTTPHLAPVSLVRLIPLGASLYLATQLADLLRFVPDEGVQSGAATMGFLGGLVSKVTYASGLLVLFVSFNEMTRARVRHLEGTRKILGRLSHEAGTPLSQLAIYIQVATANIRQKESVQPLLDDMQGAVNRLGAILEAAEQGLTEYLDPIDVGATLEFPTPRTRILRVSNANTLMERAAAGVKLTRRAEAAQINWRYDYSANCCIECDPHEIVQVATNLLRNALDAMASNDGGRTRDLLIATKNVKGAQRGHVELRVSDSGHGIPTELRERVFDEGYSTREGVNRGRGLALVREHVASNGGVLELISPAPSQNNVQYSTLFILRFPRVPCRH